MKPTSWAHGWDSGPHTADLSAVYGVLAAWGLAHPVCTAGSLTGPPSPGMLSLVQSMTPECNGCQVQRWLGMCKMPGQPPLPSVCPAATLQARPAVGYWKAEADSRASRRGLAMPLS